ncbi:uncharacterized protein LOC109603059 [Aethina tumida]|nr:uncharacterized protein LOC109603059 [Aethina tumida]
MKKKNILSFLRSIYGDRFKWSIVKSIGIFALGIRIAQECVGVEVIPSQ